MFRLFKRSEKGQAMVEYGLILALVSIVALGALGGIGDKLDGNFEEVVGAVSGGEVILEDGIIPEDEALYTDEEIEEVDGLVAEGYIPIATPDELDNLRNNTTQTFGKGTKWKGDYTSGLDKNYIQVADIDLDGKDNFEPIGTNGNNFKGTFDGGGYVISNLTVDRDSGDYAGLFGRAEDASFKNIGLENANVKGGNFVGGLVGNQHSSLTTNSYATGKVTGNGNVGGLVGLQQDSSKVINSYSTGNVTGTGNNVGGLVGSQYISSEVINSYTTGNVTSKGSYVGGLVGQQSISSITNSYYDTKTTGQSDTRKGVGKSTDEMQKKDTYVDWDFESIWKIESGQYPTLR